MFSKRTNWFLEENSFAKKIREVKARGSKFIDLAESNPTRCGFQYPKEIIETLQNSKNLAYEPSSKGFLEARKAISQYYAFKGTNVNPEQIILTTGTSEAYSHIFRLLTNPGDKVVSPMPSYPLLDYLADLNDVQLEPYLLQYDDSWKVNFQSLNLANVKAFILIHPNNPTGSYLKKDELSKLNSQARKNNCAIISDEVFLDYELKKTPNRILSLAQNEEALTFTLSGISKVLALPQMKLGWIVVSGPEALVCSATGRLEVIADTYLSVSTPIQNAFLSWISFLPNIQTQILSRIQANLRILEKQIASVQNCELLSVEGGWHAILNTKQVDEEKFVLELLDKESIYIQPGYFFGFEKPSNFVVSLLPETTLFETGIQKTLQLLTQTPLTTS